MAIRLALRIASSVADRDAEEVGDVFGGPRHPNRQDVGAGFGRDGEQDRVVAGARFGLSGGHAVIAQVFDLHFAGTRSVNA